MCGICGILSYKPLKGLSSLIEGMNSSLVHRGPDDGGYYMNVECGMRNAELKSEIRNPKSETPIVALGHRRLSIIDISRAGHQPMCNEDGTIWITYNGEIYNFPEIKQELLKKGHVFNSNTDTEVIIHLYEEMGTGCLDRLNGMFAFGLWDQRKKRLFAARDRVGIKPFYYSFDGRIFLFASEIKAILGCSLIEKEIDKDALTCYFKYFYVPAPLSIFSKVKKLLPGHYLVLENGRLSIERYWDPYPTEGLRMGRQEMMEEFMRIFNDAVRIRLISDVPLGAFLSGGIDSSAVVASMSGQGNTQARTFSVGYTKKDYFDETEYARMVAKKFNTDHKEFIVDPKFIDVLPDIIWNYDEPFADAAFFPTYLLSKLTAQEVKVVLTGDGGDELFAGYERYWSELLADYYRLIPSAIRKKVIGRLAEDVMCQIIPSDRRLHHIFNKIAKKTELMEYGPAGRYERHFHAFSGRDLKALLNIDDTEGGINPIQVALDEGEGLDYINRLLYCDIKNYLPDQMLTKVDRATMAHSLEARIPFLDYRLIEFSLKVPSRHKITLFGLKLFLKKAFDEILPREIMYRPKHGFEVPLEQWFRGDLVHYTREILSEENLKEHGYIDPPAVNRIIEGHIKKKANYGKQIFGLIVFELWHRRFIALGQEKSACGEGLKTKILNRS